MEVSLVGAGGEEGAERGGEGEALAGSVELRFDFLERKTPVWGGGEWEVEVEAKGGSGVRESGVAVWERGAERGAVVNDGQSATRTGSMIRRMTHEMGRHC